MEKSLPRGESIRFYVQFPIIKITVQYMRGNEKRILRKGSRRRKYDISNYAYT